MTTPIYLDSNATTQVHPQVLEAMLPFLRDAWHNPSAGYSAGRAVKAALETARERVAEWIGASPHEVIFTGCGTESNNLAIQSMAGALPVDSPHILVSTIEHSAVFRPTEALAERGFQVSRISVLENGRVDLSALERQLASAAGGIVSIMWANNETGVVQPIPEIAEMAKAAGCLVHTDAIQAVGKVPVRVDEVPVDYLSISGHKFHAPKGVGALYVRQGSPLEPAIRGGGQESGRRSGTENVAYAVGLGEAAVLMQHAAADGTLDRVKSLRDQLESALAAQIPGLQLNGARENRTGNVAHVSFPGKTAAEMLPALDAAGLQCSAGSACMTGKSQPSHVQKAMGFSDERALSSLRLSLSIFTTEEEIERAVEILTSICG
ncbi:MAG: cysteine desulfurase family protein [Verrucomicrobiota bacterium]